MIADWRHVASACALSCLAAGSVSASDVFLPGGYDGSRGAIDVTNIADFPPICSTNGGLPGLDLVRAYVGSESCPGNSASRLLPLGADFTLLIDDTRTLSAYMLSELRRYNALQNVGGREVVKPTTLNLSAGIDNITVLIVGEFAYRNDANPDRWFAALDRSTSNALVVAGMSGGSSSGNVVNRVEWNTFKSTPQFQQFVDAVRTMKANTNAADSNSWEYWVAIHRNHCPHHVAYFLGWHRGYVYLFERKIQELSGNPDFRLPYWDYYSNPNIPVEFTRNPGSNPLYNPRRNTNVSPALWPPRGDGAFDGRFTNFQRGRSNAFEPEVEQLPHDPVHDTIGGDMGRVPVASNDPIFWVHHANIDRLWSAWVAAGNGRRMPPDSDSYWSGRFNFGNGVTLDRNRTIDTRRSLAYDYDDTTLPRRTASGSSTPPAGPGGSGAMNIRLNESNKTVPVPVSAGASRALASIRSAGEEQPGISLVFSGINLTAAGQDGGFYYLVYANLPAGASTAATEAEHLVGTIGPFEISAAAQHRAQGHGDGSLSLIVPSRVSGQLEAGTGELNVTFIRVNGENFPRGDVITIRSIELRADDESSEMPIA